MPLNSFENIQESAIGHLDAHLEWKFIWYRIISLYWTNEQFRGYVEHVNEDGSIVNHPEPLDAEQVRNLVRHFLGYEISKDVNVTFSIVEDRRPNRARAAERNNRRNNRRNNQGNSQRNVRALIENGYAELQTHISTRSENLNSALNNATVDTKQPNQSPNPWKDMPPMEVKLTLPPPPKDVDNAVALAVYANSGKGYPFTSGGG